MVRSRGAQLPPELRDSDWHMIRLWSTGAGPCLVTVTRASGVADKMLPVLLLPRRRHFRRPGRIAHENQV